MNCVFSHSTWPVSVAEIFSPGADRRKPTLDSPTDRSTLRAWLRLRRNRFIHQTLARLAADFRDRSGRGVSGVGEARS